MRGESAMIGVLMAASHSMLFRTFLINEDWNINLWSVTREAIIAAMKSAIGIPGVLHTACDLSGCKHDHPALHPGMACPAEAVPQEEFAVSRVVDVEWDEGTGTLYAIHRTTDPELMRMIEAGEVRYVSPAICPRPGSETKTRSNGQELDRVDAFTFLHVAFVSEPAYGERATVDAVMAPGAKRPESRRLVAPALQAAWDESKHPRDADGKFTGDGGEGGPHAAKWSDEVITTRSPEESERLNDEIRRLALNSRVYGGVPGAGGKGGERGQKKGGRAEELLRRADEDIARRMKAWEARMVAEAENMHNAGHWDKARYEREMERIPRRAAEVTREYQEEHRESLKAARKKWDESGGDARGYLSFDEMHGQLMASADILEEISPDRQNPDHSHYMRVPGELSAEADERARATVTGGAKFTEMTERKRRTKAKSITYLGGDPEGLARLTKGQREGLGRELGAYERPEDAMRAMDEAWAAGREFYDNLKFKPPRLAEVTDELWAQRGAWGLAENDGSKIGVWSHKTASAALKFGIAPKEASKAIFAHEAMHAYWDSAPALQREAFEASCYAIGSISAYHQSWRRKGYNYGTEGHSILQEIEKYPGGPDAYYAEGGYEAVHEGKMRPASAKKLKHMRENFDRLREVRDRVFGRALAEDVLRAMVELSPARRLIGARHDAVGYILPNGLSTSSPEGAMARKVRRADGTLEIWAMGPQGEAKAPEGGREEASVAAGDIAALQEVVIAQARRLDRKTRRLIGRNRPVGGTLRLLERRTGAQREKLNKMRARGVA